jgi:hypothetical protein
LLQSLSEASVADRSVRLTICGSWKIAIGMITVNDFRRRILDRELDWLVDEVLLAGPAAHLKAPEIAYIRASLAAKFGVLAQDVVGCGISETGVLDQ